VKIIACIEESGVMKKILDHLNATTSADTPMRPESRAPPQGVLERRCLAGTFPVLPGRAAVTRTVS